MKSDIIYFGMGYTIKKNIQFFVISKYVSYIMMLDKYALFNMLNNININTRKYIYYK
jgi:hypothetical protein